MTEALVSSRFVLLGEDHFSREIPQFAAALCDLIHPDVSAVEAGPYAARFVGSFLGRSDRVEQVRHRDQAHPDNMAFLDVQEENDLAAHCAAASRSAHFELWGLDQEYVGSAGTLLEAMMDTKPGPQTTAAITAAMARDRSAEAEARTSGKLEQLFLLASTEADVAPLEQAVATDGNAATKALFSEFIASRHIYQMHLEGLPDANMVRAQLLKRHFMADYTRLQARNSEARVFFKFGGMHTGKGFSFLHQRDLGNFVAEQADLEQAKSLHIFVMGVHGVRAYPGAYGRPVVPQPFDLRSDPERKWLAPALTPGPQDSRDKGATWTLFDLRKLRFGRVALPSEWEHLVYSYDLLIIVPEFTASTPIL